MKEVKDKVDWEDLHCWWFLTSLKQLYIYSKVSGDELNAAAGRDKLIRMKMQLPDIPA